MQSQIKRLIRSNYSNPPIYSGALVETVLASPELRAQWELELQAMRERIKLMRSALSENVSSKSGIDFSFITEQRGMFSYSGLTREQVVKLREDYSIYAVESGRICVAALNNSNISLVSEAIANVVD